MYWWRLPKPCARRHCLEKTLSESVVPLLHCSDKHPEFVSRALRQWILNQSPGCNCEQRALDLLGGWCQPDTW